MHIYVYSLALRSTSTNRFLLYLPLSCVVGLHSTHASSSSYCSCLTVYFSMPEDLCVFVELQVYLG